MTRKLEVVAAEDPLSRAVDLFLEHHFGALPVIDADGRLAGILTTHDVIRATQELLGASRVGANAARTGLPARTSHLNGWATRRPLARKAPTRPGVAQPPRRAYAVYALDATRAVGGPMHRFITVDGNEAAARVAHLLSEVIAIYPITPASAMGEHAEAWSRAGGPTCGAWSPR